MRLVFAISQSLSEGPPMIFRYSEEGIIVGASLYVDFGDDDGPWNVGQMMVDGVIVKRMVEEGGAVILFGGEDVSEAFVSGELGRGVPIRAKQSNP